MTNKRDVLYKVMCAALVLMLACFPISVLAAEEMVCEKHSYESGLCTGCGDADPEWMRTLTLAYDDRYDISGKTVEIIDAGTPVSNDAAVVALADNTLRAVGVGVAEIKINGLPCTVTVEKAKINLVMVVGQSNSGNHFPNATSAVTCPAGTAYYWGYGAKEPEDYVLPSMGFHAPLLAELYAQSVAAGDPVKNVLIWAEGYTSKNGQSITAWAVEQNGSINTAGTDGAANMLRDCLKYYEDRSDRFEICDKVVFCNHGTTDHKMDTQRYINLFTAMWERLKAEGMEYLGFLRVRGAHSLNTPENVDVYYNSASAAQFELTRTREDMFMVSTIAENWIGPVDTVYSIDISRYISMVETYGQSPEYTDRYGNRASYADGVLTTTMKELYGSNNKVHYGIFGYGIIGADAAVNMYSALNGGGAPSVVQTDSSGMKSAEKVSAMGSEQSLDIEGLAYDLCFYPSCGSPAGTMDVTVTSEGRDITETVVSRENSSYGCIDTQALRDYPNGVITVGYTYSGVREQVVYTLKYAHPCNDGHSYTAAVTEPTCTEQGYITYTCACGHSYVDNYVDATGHSYEKGACVTCGASRPEPSWEQGTIAYANGLNRAETTRLRTKDYLPIEDYDAVTLGEGYTLVRFVYDENYQYLNGTTWLGDGVGFRVDQLREQYPDAAYFRVALRAMDSRELTAEEIADTGICFYEAGAELPKPDWTHSAVMNLSVSQDGVVYDGKVFSFGGSGTCTVYDLANKTKLGSFVLAKKEVLNPHANSVCFSDTFYAPGDKYPLLYVNIYNNYSSATDRMEGTCCVYRLTETDGQFATELVQVIRIGFTEDLTLWKSKENNGDTRPYGNFVVDTDEDELYAFVMRDAGRTTRFFRFDLPAISAGTYSEAYGCNVVTLTAEDVLAQFDTPYMNYMQGCCYADGKILSVEGFGAGTSAVPALRIIDLQTQKQIRMERLEEQGLTKEPELISVYDGTVYYASADNVLRILTLDDLHFHSYRPEVTVPTDSSASYITYTCTACGDSYMDACPDVLSGHLQALPDGVYAHTNLWPLLEPENAYFYAGTHWGTLDDVVSVTVPISQGDQIYASSFKRGIRVAFFGVEGLLVSRSSEEVKAEFEENGYITAPEGTIAVNVPMWEDSADNVLRILTLERIECQKHVFAQQETVVEAGLVSKGSAVRQCENCGYMETVEIPELMRAGEYPYEDGDASIVLPYRIYYPSSYENSTQAQYPIVIFYHGAGSRGTNNQSQVLGKAIVDRLIKLDNCIILAPQCNTDYQWVNTPWSKGSYDSASIQKSVYLDASIALLDEIVLSESVDEDRVYAIGLSMGGYATWNVAMEYPEKFAAVVPICGAADPNRANEVLGVAVWAFHGDKDATVPVSGSREMIGAMRALGGVDVRYTEYPGVGHDCWTKAFAEPELTDWLFSQIKHTHSFETEVTEPTCTGQGYTTYTCSCGESFVDDYVDATGHSYEKGLCVNCGGHIPGDINGDGKVNNKDATRLFQHLSGWAVEVVEEALDVNGDGKVNNKDATRLFQYLSGWQVEIH